jgi:hypothetical protein
MLGGAAVAFLLQALLSIMAMISLFRWRHAHAAPVLPPERLMRAIATGLRYVSATPLARQLIFRSGLFGFCLSALLALLPLVAQHQLEAGPSLYGSLLAAFGCGALVGGVARSGPSRSRRRLIIAGNLGAGLAILGIAASNVPGWSLFLMATVGGCWVLVMTSLSICLQLTTPRWVIGRVIAINQAVAYAGMALGSALWGAAAHFAGVQAVLMTSGLLTLMSLLLDRRTILPEGNGPDLTPLRPKPIDRVDMVTGDLALLPVIVSIDYSVEARNGAEFAAAMQELRRIRNRDGAVNWSLQQAVDGTGTWRESFVVECWVEYLRFQTRPTAADQALRDRVRKLHDADIVVVRHIDRAER